MSARETDDKGADGGGSYHDEVAMLEFIEHLRDRRDSGAERAPYWHLLGFRLLPLCILCLLWAALDTWLYPTNEAAAKFAKMGAYFLTPVGAYFIHARLYEPRFGWPWPPDNGWQGQIRSFSKGVLGLAGLIVLVVTALSLDLSLTTPVSCTLVASSVLLFVWWWLSGTRGRLFRAENDWRLATLRLPFRLVVWELVRRHYCLILAGIVFLASLAPLSGLVESRAFVDAVLLEALASPVIAALAFFDHLRLERLYGGSRFER